MPVPLSVSEAKRVSAPMRSAANWSSEMVFLKLGAPGCGAAVTNEYSAPPSTAGCDSPEKISSQPRTMTGPTPRHGSGCSWGGKIRV